jgi:uncharacterized membrane protein
MSKRPAESDDIQNAPGGRRARLPGIDVARGLALAAMAVYHFTWDLGFFGLIRTDPVTHTGWALFARTIAASFLFLVGVGLALWHRNGADLHAFIRRFITIAVAAALITIGTRFATPDDFIFFGILHHIAVASLVGLLAVRTSTTLLVVGAGAAFTLPAVFAHPLFSEPTLVWIGLAPVPPRTNDFVPILPWIGWTLLGVVAGRASDRLPALASPPRSAVTRLLGRAGRHSLAIYLLHQPILIAMIWGVIQFGLAQPLPTEKTDFGSACTNECMATGGEEAVCRRVCSCIMEDLAGHPLLSDSVSPLLAADERRLAESVGRCRAGR